ncbi:hypothetical protein MMC16_003310 [Acarospora aff. strigata]|nr:hypothetical protein [Acarospora aff. strigata]
MRSHVLGPTYLAVILALTHLGICAPPAPKPVMTQARFNCPDRPAPSGMDPRRYPSLYRFCVSRAGDCDCHEDDRYPGLNLYAPKCDVDRSLEQHDAMLQARQVCQNSCMCYGGPPENWYRWPAGPMAVGPVGPMPNVLTISLDEPDYRK